MENKDTEKFIEMFEIDEKILEVYIEHIKKLENEIDDIRNNNLIYKNYCWIIFRGLGKDDSDNFDYYKCYEQAKYEGYKEIENLSHYINILRILREIIADIEDRKRKIENYKEMFNIQMRQLTS